VGIFGSTFPSFIEGNNKANPEKMSRMAGKQRTDHVLTNPLGLDLCLGPHPAVDIEPRVPPGEKAFRPLGAEEFPPDKISENL
jgi:hypothetical protein